MGTPTGGPLVIMKSRSCGLSEQLIARHDFMRAQTNAHRPDRISFTAARDFPTDPGFGETIHYGPRRKPRVIGLYSSAPQMGKTSVRDVLTRSHRFEPIAFAGALKSIAGQLLSLSGSSLQEIDYALYGGGKEVELGEPFHCTPRKLLQTLGTAWGRDMIHPDIWLNIARTRIIKAVGMGADVVIDDVRFPNEAELITDDDRWHGSIVKVERPGVADATGQFAEGLLEDWTFDGTITNDSTLDALPDRINTLLKDLS